MRKAFHISFFVLILCSLLAMVPPINHALKSQLTFSNSSFTFTIPDPVFVDPPQGFPSGVQYIQIYTGQIAYYASFDVSPAHSTNCEYAHLHTPPGSPTFDINGEFIEDPDPTGCGLGRDPGSVSITEDPIVTLDGSTTGTGGDSSTGTGSTGSSGTTDTGTTGSIGSGTTGGVGALPPPEEEEELYCPESAPIKQFDYGTAGWGENTNIPLTAETAPHFVSHTQFYAVKIGDTVDAPEYGRYDKATINGTSGSIEDADQDGLLFAESNQGQLTFNIEHLVGDGANPALPATTRLGTLIVYRYEKINDTVYDFRVLDAVKVTRHGKITLPISPTALQQQGWIGVIYTMANSQDVFDTGAFTLNAIKSEWNGTHPSLMRILFGFDLTDPFDPSIPPGEIEEYRYCNKDQNDDGLADFSYYLPDDPAFSAHCDAPLPEPPEVILNTPTTNTQPINVICNFNNVQNFVCDPTTGTGTGTGGTTGTGTVTPPLDSRPVTEILEEMLSNYNGNQSNNAQTRLEIIHQYLSTLLPRL